MVHNGHQTPCCSVAAITESALKLPQYISADPKLIRDAFDHEDFTFELKMDGFRGVAYIGKSEARLVSEREVGYTAEHAPAQSCLANGALVSLVEEASLQSAGANRAVWP
jgi:hypothetical protein